MRKQFTKIALVAGFGLAMAFTLSCSSDSDDNPPPPAVISSSGGSSSSLGSSFSSSSNSSSSSSPLSTVWCLYHGTCTATTIENCTILGGQAVAAQNCPATSSSSAWSSSSSVAPVIDNTFTDERDDKSYKWVEIGTQIWMAENLNFNVEGLSKCYDDDPDNCAIYGGLYDWATALNINLSCNNSFLSGCGATVSPNHQGICPDGWHLPSNADWNVLMKFANPECPDDADCPGAGTKLKANSSLWNTNTGTDNYGFSALPDGTGISFGDFGSWWSTFENSATQATYRYMEPDNEKVGYFGYLKSTFRSVRCLQDDD